MRSSSTLAAGAASLLWLATATASAAVCEVPNQFPTVDDALAADCDGSTGPDDILIECSGGPCTYDPLIVSGRTADLTIRVTAGSDEVIFESPSAIAVDLRSNAGAITVEGFWTALGNDLGIYVEDSPSITLRGRAGTLAHGLAPGGIAMQVVGESTVTASYLSLNESWIGLQLLRRHGDPVAPEMTASGLVLFGNHQAAELWSPSNVCPPHPTMVAPGITQHHIDPRAATPTYAAPSGPSLMLNDTTNRELNYVVGNDLGIVVRGDAELLADHVIFTMNLAEPVTTPLVRQWSNPADYDLASGYRLTPRTRPLDHGILLVLDSGSAIVRNFVAYDNDSDCSSRGLPPGATTCGSPQCGCQTDLLPVAGGYQTPVALVHHASCRHGAFEAGTVVNNEVDLVFHSDGMPGRAFLRASVVHRNNGKAVACSAASGQVNGYVRQQYGVGCSFLGGPRPPQCECLSGGDECRELYAGEFTSVLDENSSGVEGACVAFYDATTSNPRGCSGSCFGGLDSAWNSNLPTWAFGPGQALPSFSGVLMPMASFEPMPGFGIASGLYTGGHWGVDGSVPDVGDWDWGFHSPL